MYHCLTITIPGGSSACLLFRPQADFGPVRLVGLGHLSRRLREPEVEVCARETRGCFAASRQTQRVREQEHVLRTEQKGQGQEAPRGHCVQAAEGARTARHVVG